MKKGFIKLFSILFSIVFIFSSFILCVELLHNPFTNTFEYELSSKCDLLKNTKEKKIVFVGNSSVPFGIDSRLIKNEFNDYEVIDFGLYASIGTKAMLEILKKYIREDDIIILMPELNSQTMSLYFNAPSLARGVDGFSVNLSKISFSNKLNYFYNYYKYAFEKISYLGKEDVDPIGIYRKDSFNEYGDIIVNREKNIMDNGIDPSMLITFDVDYLSKDFVDFCNDYNKYVKRKGADIYFCYSPMNKEAISSSKNAMSIFDKKLREELNFEVLGDYNDSIIEKGYFYDTNFHLNSSGVVLFTDKLIDNIVPIIKDERKTSFDIPVEPTLAEEETVEIDGNTLNVDFSEYNGEPNNDFIDAFNYQLVGSTYQIVSVKEEYKYLEKVILPSVYNGKNITSIKENAFLGCNKLEEIYIGKTYKSLMGKVFNGCLVCKKIYLFHMDCNVLSVSTDQLLVGVPRTVTIMVPKDSNYKFGYSWENYVDKIEFNE